MFRISCFDFPDFSVFPDNHRRAGLSLAFDDLLSALSKSCIRQLGQMVNLLPLGHSEVFVQFDGLAVYFPVYSLGDCFLSFPRFVYRLVCGVDSPASMS